VNDKPDKKVEPEVVGLIPAAGLATRIAPLPCSKELYPVGFRVDCEGQSGRPIVVCECLLEKMRQAGVTRAYIVLRKGKWDIPAYLGDGSMVNMHLAYLMMGLPFGVPYTIDQAYSFVQDAVIAFGFADMLFSSNDAFERLVAQLKITGSHVVLGSFPADRPQKVDMIDVADDGKVRKIVIKPNQTHLSYTWGIAAWKPEFTRFMHEYLDVVRKAAPQKPELFVGDVIQAAIKDGLKVEALQVSDEPFIDIGTAEDLRRAMNKQVCSFGRQW
jgi:glucose-1-phosphate thymidylyltransferase